MKITNDGNGGTHIKFSSAPGRVKISIASGIVFTILLTVGGWVYGVGEKSEKLNNVIANDSKQDERIISIEKKLSDIEVMKNDIKWIRESIEKVGKKEN